MKSTHNVLAGAPVQAGSVVVLVGSRDLEVKGGEDDVHVLNRGLLVAGFDLKLELVVEGFEFEFDFELVGVEFDFEFGLESGVVGVRLGGLEFDLDVEGGSPGGAGESAEGDEREDRGLHVC